MPSAPQAGPSEPLIIRLNPGAAVVVNTVHLVFALLQALFAWWVARTPDLDREITAGFQGR